MESILLGLVPLVIGISLLFVAFRAHERYWALGFMGWRRVYAGLVLFLFSAILTAIWPWTSGSGAEAVGRLVLWQITSGLAAAAGIGLVLAGAIERLRELSEERERLNDVRAGFDLFDSLREISAQPYAFLEILDFSLKEIVRAAGAECGGVWLYNPGRSEWVLTGWAGMSEKLRQQTESVRGSGTGFDRLAVTHKARLFRTTDEIRAFFPEWEPEGFQSILGLPLATGTIGTPGRQILGVIVLADRSSSHFDDDRARRLYAASDYIAAVIAEARITRQLEAVRQQLDSTHAEWDRDRLEAQRQREAHEKRVQEMKMSWEDEKRALEADSISRLTALQAKADAEFTQAQTEWDRQRQEFQTRHQADEQKLHKAKSSWNEERHALEEHHAAQLREVQSQTRAQIDQTRADFDRRAAANAAAEQERTSQMQQRWEDARRDHETAVARFESERAEWGHRLDQSNQDRQTERDLARKREEQLTAANQETQTVLMQRIDDLQSMLLAEQNKVAHERDALQVASHAVAELESALTAERIERETELAAERVLHQTELANELAARQSEVAAITSRLEDERNRAAQDRSSVEQELHAARQLLEEREKQLSAHLVTARQAAAEAQAHYQETMETLRQTSENAVAELQSELTRAHELKLTIEQELLSTRLMFDEREREFLGRIEAERRATRELEAHYAEDQSIERQHFETVLQNLEEELGAANARMELLEGEMQSIQAEQTAREERARQELVEQHLNSRRQMNAVKTRREDMTQQLQAVLGTSDSETRLAMLFQSLSRELPTPVELYLWQRDSEAGDRLTAWMDRDEKLRSGPGLEPWSFELRTIPAEGVTRFSGPDEWKAVLRAHDDAHCTRWLEHWGSGSEPTWVVCWPWRLSTGDSDSGNGHTTGWLTAFGFGPLVIDDEQVTQGGQWVSFLASATAGMKALPLPVPEDHADTPAAPISAAQTELPESPEDLNNVILEWAASQTEDALRLELSSRSKVEVEPSWLRALLDRGRRLCRSGESNGSEFSVTTVSHNGRTTLRLLRSSIPGDSLPPDVTSVDDSDLTGMHVSNRNTVGDSAAARPAEPVKVAGSWLIREGDRLGLELHFEDHSHHSEPETSEPSGTADTDPPEEPLIRNVLVVNFQSAMNDLIVGMLESLGHHVQSADVPTAPDMIDSQGTDLVVVAATPETAGWDFAHWVKESIPALPVIAVIGDEAIPMGADASCDLILRIPFQIDELDRKIRSVVTREAAPHARE